MKICTHGFDLFGMFCSEVILFTDVFLKVIKVDAAVFVALDELEVTLTNDSSGDAALVAVVWVVPVEITFGERDSFESRCEVNAIDFVIVGNIGCFCESGVEVDGADRLATDGTSFGNSRVAHNPRDANAAFVNPPLAASEREIGSG